MVGRLQRVVHDFGIGERDVDVRVLAEIAQHRFHLVGQPHIVLVRQEDKIARAQPHGLFKVFEVTRGLVVLHQNPPDMRVVSGKLGYGGPSAVRGAIVANHHLVYGVALLYYAVQLFLHKAFAIVRTQGNRQGM